MRIITRLMKIVDKVSLVGSKIRFFSVLFRKKVSAFVSSVYSYLCYDWLLTKLIYIKRCKCFLRWFSEHFEMLMGIVAVVFSLVFAALMIRFFGIDMISNGPMANLFIGVGAMSGSVLVIIFSLSLFSLQNSANLYSSRFFEVYTHGFKEKFIYISIALITLTFFSFAILWSGKNQIPFRSLKIGSIYAILPMMAFLFVVISVQFKGVRKKINPVHALKFLEKQSSGFLDEISNEIDRATKLITLKYKGKDEKYIRLSISNDILLREWGNLDRQIENLIEISMRLSAKHELGTVDNGMKAVGNILIKFMSLKRDCSIALPSALAPLALESDSQNFTGSIMDRLNRAGDDFMKNQLTQNAVTILNVYKAIANAAKDTKFLNTDYQNPVLGQVIGYLGMYIDSAMRYGDVEVVYQAIFISDGIAQSISKKMETTPYHQIENKIVNIAAYGIQTQKSFIINQCNESLLNILTRIVQNEMRDTEISGVLKHIKSIIVGTHSAKIAGLLHDDFNIEYGVNNTFNRLTEIIGLIARIHKQKKDNEEKRHYEGQLIEAFEEVSRILRSITEEIKDCDNAISQAASTLIYNWNRFVISMLEQKEFSDIDSLKNRMSWNIHLPCWFVHHAQHVKHSIYFEETIEAPTKTGLILLNKDIDDELAEKCIDAAFSITTTFLEKSPEGHGYDEPRTMLRVCYLGVLALRKDKKALFNKVVGMVRSFEKMYQKKYPLPSNLPEGVKPEDVLGLPSKDQLQKEFLKWESDFIREQLNRIPIRQDSEDMMLSLVDISDIHRFIFEVWGTIFADSPVKDELVEKKKKNLQKS